MEIKCIGRYYFSAGGVVVTRLGSLVLKAVERRNGKQAEGMQRTAVFDLENGVYTGRLGADGLLQGLIRQGLWTGSAAELRAAVLSAVVVDSGALATAVDLKGGGEVFIYSGFPREWWDGIAQRCELEKAWDGAHVIHSSELRPADSMAGLFNALNAAGHAVAGRDMWIDAHPLRTSAAIRRRLDAIVYVDERRLRRELGLRGLPGGLPGYR